MALNDVKELTIPVNGVDKAVKKIEDANGNIIWGSQTEYPYRRLEYIHFNGTDNYVSFGTGRPSFSRIDTIVAKIINAPNDSGFGGYSYNGSWPRYYIPRFASDNKLRFAVSNSWSKYITYTPNTKLKFIMKTGSSLTATCTCELRDANDTLIDSDTITPTQASGGTSANNPVIYLGALSSIINASDTQHAQNFLSCDIYLWRRTALDGTSNLYHAYPAQRKSDGAVGVFWPQNNRFDVMEGTVNSSSMGPVVDEYWDGSDPA